MRTLLLAALAIGATLTVSAPAEARGGCGIGFHRGPHGGCRPNRGPGFAGPGGPVVGTYYARRGWWDGRRYWRNRYRWHNGWRYR